VLAASVATVLGQAPEKKDAGRPAQPPPWQRVLQGEEARRVETLEKSISEREKQARFAEAVPPAREALVIRRLAQGEDHWETVNARIKEQTDARAAGLPREAQSELAKAIRQEGEAEKAYLAHRLAEAERLLRINAEIFGRILGEDHPDTAERHHNRAVVLDALGKYAEAEPLLRQARATWRRTLGEDHPNAALGTDDLAANLDYQGRYGEAEPLYREALAIRRRVLGEEDFFTTLSYDHLAANLTDQGRVAEAEPMLQKALAIRRRTLGEDDARTGDSYNNLAYNLLGQRKQDAIEPLLRKALVIRRRALGEDDPDTATSYNNLGAVLRDQGQYAEAEELLRKSLEIHRRLRGEDHPDVGGVYANLGVNMERQGKYVEAEALFRQAQEVHRRTLGEDHPHTAVSDARLADSLSAQGKYAEAEPFLKKALEIRRAVGEDHPDTAQSYRSLAALLHAQGKDDAAEAMALAAARSFEAARLRISFAGLGRTEFASRGSPAPLLAALLATRGQDLEAWRRWESGLARGLFDDLAARRSRSLTADERRRQEDLIGQVNRLDNQIGLLAGARTPTDEQRKRLEALKGNRLELQGRLVQLEEELVRKYRVAAGEVYALDRIQARLPADAALVGWLDLKTMPGTADPRGDHWACVVRRAGAPRWIRIPGTGPGRAWSEDDDRRPGQVRQLLGGDDRPAWQEPLASLASQRLDPLEAALAAVEGLPAVRHLIVLPSPDLAGIPVEAMLEARQAHAPHYLVSYAPSGTLFAWLEERRGEDRDVPARSRRLLALGDPVPPPADDPGSPTARPPDQGLLVQRVGSGSTAERAGIRPGDVLLRYAGAALANRDDLQKRIGAGDPATGVVVSVWREGRTLELALRPGLLGVALDDRPAAEALGARRAAEALIRRTRGAAFAPLPGSRREVQAIADLFDQRVVDVGSSASEQTLASLRDRGELASFGVIHLATHGEIDDLAPMSSRLLLSQDHLTDPTAAASLEGPVYDGILTAGEVLGTWKLNAELVTLSACRSGLGRQGGGEGYVGFAQAFFLAGARGLVVSLWEVDDRATSLLMTRFYQNWLGKRAGLGRPLSKAEALSEAKVWLRSLTADGVDRELASISRGEVRSRSGRPETGHPFAHPHDWAGFILVGDPY
jgi:tetratricopeptide (TPR) repeat protein